MEKTTHNDIAQLFRERVQRPPANGELFLHEGTLWVWRGVRGSWESLGTDADPAGYAGTGQLEFELQPGIVVRGSPAFVLSLVMRAFYDAPSDKAKDFVQLVYNVFRECGWRGPPESDVSPRPGTVSVGSNLHYNHKLDDIRPVLSQLQDPEFNGWLNIDDGTGLICFHNVQKVDSVMIREGND